MFYQYFCFFLCSRRGTYDRDYISLDECWQGNQLQEQGQVELLLLASCSIIHRRVIHTEETSRATEMCCWARVIFAVGDLGVVVMWFGEGDVSGARRALDR